VEELMDILTRAGFRDIKISEKQNSDEVIRSWKFGEGVEKMVVSAYIGAVKPDC